MTGAAKGYTRLENTWLMEFLKDLPAAEAVRLFLQSRAHLNRPGADLGTIISALVGRDVRTVQRVLDALLQKGLVEQVDGLYLAPGAGQSHAKLTGILMPNSSNLAEENTAPAQVEQAPELSRTKGNQEEQTHTPPTPPQHPTALPEALRATAGMEQAWQKWITFRLQERPHSTPDDFAAHLAVLTDAPNPLAVIEQSLQHRWVNLYRVKNARRASAAPRPQQINAIDWDEEARKVEAQYAAGWN